MLWNLYTTFTREYRLRLSSEDFTTILAKLQQAFSMIGSFPLRFWNILTDLPRRVAQSGLLLRPGGFFAAGIPTEGGFLWGLGWRMTTGVAYRLRTGLDAGVIMRHEHVNNAQEILAIIEYFFEEVTIEHFPLPTFHWSFYTSIKASQPHIEWCRRYLSSRNLLHE
jgi:hypothetical protein